jgi:hypothetical protein
MKDFHETEDEYKHDFFASSKNIYGYFVGLIDTSQRKILNADE